MEMVEKVAEAIRLHTTDAHWTPEGLARAALEAMREPTEAMVQAGVTADPGKTLGERVTNCHAAMIDAALSPSGEK